MKTFFSDYNSFIKTKLKSDSTQSQSMKGGSANESSCLVDETESKKNRKRNEKFLMGNKTKNNERKTLLPVKVGVDFLLVGFFCWRKRRVMYRKICCVFLGKQI